MSRALRIPATLLLSTILLLSMYSCNTTGCTDNRSSLLLAGFYSDVTERSIQVDSLEIGGVDAPNDSLLVTADDRLSQFYIPLRSQNTEASYCIHYAATNLDFPELNDTITIGYTGKPYFASEECGAVYLYNIHRFDYTRHLIDSIALTDSLINNANVERMKIYFRTASNDTESYSQL